VVRQEGGLASGCFVLRWNNKVHYLAGFFDREERASRPAVLLQMESILRAVRDGYRWYDFLPSGGHSSVEVFKEGFGGRRVPLATWTRRGGLHRLRPGAGRGRLPRRATPFLLSDERTDTPLSLIAARASPAILVRSLPSDL